MKFGSVDVPNKYWAKIQQDLMGETPKKNFTFDVVNKERNADIRRVLILFYEGGLAGYLKDGGGKVIEEDETGQQMLEMDIDGRKIHFIKMVNATPEPLNDCSVVRTELSGLKYQVEPEFLMNMWLNEPKSKKSALGLDKYGRKYYVDRFKGNNLKEAISWSFGKDIPVTWDDEG